MSDNPLAVKNWKGKVSVENVYWDMHADWDKLVEPNTHLRHETV